MQRAPHHKSPGRTVPEPAEQHGDCQIDVTQQRAAAIAAERDVEIVAQELRQRHVPAPPEIDDRGRLVGRVEVQRQEDAKHQRDPDRHVGIAGKIEIKLERIGQRADPGLIEGRCIRPERDRDQRLDAVGKAGLLEQADRKDDEAAQDQMRIGALGLGALELRDHVPMVQDGPGDQMRKVRHEQSIMRQRVARDIASECIDQECDLRKRIEGDANRQQDVDDETRRKQRVEIEGDEAGIFEDAEQQQIAPDTHGEHGEAQAGAQFPRDQEIANAVIERDRSEQQQHELPAAEAVESERRQRQPHHRGQIAAAAKSEIAGQDDRQEHEHKQVGIEEHKAFLARAEKPNHTSQPPTSWRGRLWQPLLAIRAFDPI